MIDRSRLGVVSNCWQEQLVAGQTIDDLVSRATQEFGFRHVELRQGSLGELENEDRLPDSQALAKLASRFPEVKFDLAVELPIFSQAITREDSRRDRYVDAAAALSGHLRIVDLGPCPSPDAGGDWLNPAAGNLTSLANDLPDGLVSVEHSVQAWSHFWTVFERASSRQPENLKLCFDPANLWLTGNGENAAEITKSVPINSLSMVHLKQRRGDSTLTSFAEGAVDWQSLLRHFVGSGYEGPFLFEIAPSCAVWEELAAGIEFLDRLTAS